MSGEVRLSDAEMDEIRHFVTQGRFIAVWKAVERILAARLAAVPVPSDTGLAAAVEALASDEPQLSEQGRARAAHELAGAMRASLHGVEGGRDVYEPALQRMVQAAIDWHADRLRALLSERTATTDGGGS